MKIVEREIKELIFAEYNPRQITKKQFEDLKKSLERFGFVDPVIVNVNPDRKNIIVGGHQRIRAWKSLGNTRVPTVEVNLNEKKERELNVRLNKNTGSFDFDILANEFDFDDLIEWGFEEKEILGSATEQLSNIEYKDVYYTPIDIPTINLDDCIDLSLFEKKIEVIESATLSKKKKEILKMFAYRFIKIDFENVANYYFFNADDEEKKIIERLRMVLCDNGVNGFIEDDLLRMTKFINDD